ncbi:ASCH domain-containing protein [Rhizobium leguminosarum]
MYHRPHYQAGKSVKFSPKGGKLPEHAIISIRPNYVEAILSGVKTIELRRRIPPVSVGTNLWIYATLPVGAVVAVAVAERMFRAPPSELWSRHGQKTAITKPDFDRYFSGAEMGIGIELSSAQAIQPVPIAGLKMMRQGFHPPQVIARITSVEAHYLANFANAA